MRERTLFTSESVSEGHPDKVADQISDAILDAYLQEDPNSHVACETFVTTEMVLIGGETSSKAKINTDPIIRNLVEKIGYNKSSYGFDSKNLNIMNVMHSQSPDIAQGVLRKEELKYEQGAGDQGLMFGFACNETSELMPASIQLAHKILKEASLLRSEKVIKWLAPDAKSQVTVAYEKGKITEITRVVLSHQHSEEVSNEEIRETLIEKVIKPILSPTGWISPATEYFINPTGRFVIGGPHGDAGLTGRKIIVDTYGGMARHGGGAFSGKDPSKVDRSAAYMARYIAKNIVGAGLAEKCEVQIAYAIGIAEPMSFTINTFGTGIAKDSHLEEMAKNIFELRPAGIIEQLNLKRPIYLKTASYGHFGRGDFPWEKLDQIENLRARV